MGPKSIQETGTKTGWRHATVYIHWVHPGDQQPKAGPEAGLETDLYTTQLRQGLKYLMVRAVRALVH